jgi:hypothetical protein
MADRRERMERNRQWGHPRPLNDAPKPRKGLFDDSPHSALVMCGGCGHSEIVHIEGWCLSFMCKCRGLVG